MPQGQLLAGKRLQIGLAAVAALALLVAVWTWWSSRREMPVSMTTPLRQGRSYPSGTSARASPQSRSVDAYDFYLQGAHLLREYSQESTGIAFRYFTRAVELDPSLAEAYVSLGAVDYARYLQGWGGGIANLDQAEASYEKALGLNPASMRAREYYDKSIQVSTQSGSTDAWLADALVFAGPFFDRMGEPDRAAETWRRGIELVVPRLESNPDNMDLRLFLAIYRGLLGERASLLAEKKRFSETPYVGAMGFYYMAAILPALGETEQAVELLRHAIRQGRIEPTWIQYVKVGSASALESEPFQELLREYEKEAQRLREMY